MLNKFVLSAALVVAGSAGFAQGFSGAELEIEFTDGTDVEDIGGISYSGAVEAEVGYGISVALGATAYNFDVGEDSISNLTLHGIYAIDNATSFGLFFGQDRLDGEAGELFGAEVAYDFGLGDFQAYAGRANDTSDDLTIFGVSGTYDLGSGFSFGGTVDRFSGDGFSASALELGGYYTLAQGPQFGVTFGQSNLDSGGSDVSENFFGLQASVAIGPNGGTTFDRRGIYEIIKIGPSL
ncbi:hypothetical protein [Loktanella sp. Alg231-35]|uniref:hypothetical protein n=1 Tax=Loktanella sp. Alg231-35 TaxID=1922220 RepID=UPI000D54B2D2|nr:hypothetical protein [Loktanella sp. Alg231-35]